MGIFDKLREPVVLKTDSDAQKQLEQLNSYLHTADEAIRSKIEQDIRILQYGIKGEDSLMFELKNSHIPMYILHDLFFEKDGLKAQIDYLIITRKLIIVIECKNMYGNISIDNHGNFTRSMKIGNQYIKKGIYNPITQNQRHLDMIHELRRSSKHFIFRSSFDKHFEEMYKSVVVLANPDSVIDMKYAPQAVKQKVVKADALISYIKNLHSSCKCADMTDKQMKELADFFLEQSVPNTKDYTEKYKNYQPVTEEKDICSSETNESVEVENAYVQEEAVQKADVETLPLYRKLKEYRYQKSKEENVKPYYLYNNAQLEELVRKSPRNIDELKMVSGFGDVKCSKYGNEILKIIAEDKNHNV